MTNYCIQRDDFNHCGLTICICIIKTEMIITDDFDAIDEQIRNF